MKTKQLLALAATVAAVSYATSAQAGVSFQVSIGWPAPVYVEPVRAPVCGPRVIVAPPPRARCAPRVIVRSPYVPTCAPVRIPPGRGWKHYRQGPHREYQSYGHRGHGPHGR